ncbi:MAG: cupin domain-containing protein [Xanthobacteraceae bacterium]|nr:cupin domain-containing protein [Xanthobacteraceae bacterium]
MSLHISGSAVSPQPIDRGVTRQPLLSGQEAKGTHVVIDRYAVATGASFKFDVPAGSIIWVQMLDGEGTLRTPYTNGPVGEAVSFTLPAGVQATLSTGKGVSFLQTAVHGPALGPGAAASPPRLVATDWRCEPVFKTKDGRKRVLLATPAIVNTQAFKADMVIYPPGGVGQTVHREGAETFVYVVSGRGSATSGGQRIALRDGDLACFADREPHSLEANGDGEFRFVQINAPATFETVWADARKASTWIDTGLDIEGRRPLTEWKERWAFAWRGA